MNEFQQYDPTTGERIGAIKPPISERITLFNPLNGINIPLPQRSQLLEIPLIQIGQGAKNPFPVINDLRGVNIVAIESISADVLAFGPSGNPVITNGEMQLLTTSIFNSPKQPYPYGKNQPGAQRFAEYTNNVSEAIFDNIPLVPLATNLNGGVLRYTNPFAIDFQKSTINVNATGVAAGKSAILILYY